MGGLPEASIGDGLITVDNRRQIQGGGWCSALLCGWLLDDF